MSITALNSVSVSKIEGKSAHFESKIATFWAENLHVVNVSVASCGIIVIVISYSK